MNMYIYIYIYMSILFPNNVRTGIIVRWPLRSIFLGREWLKNQPEVFCEFGWRFLPSQASASHRPRSPGSKEDPSHDAEKSARESKSPESIYSNSKELKTQEMTTAGPVCHYVTLYYTLLYYLVLPHQFHIIHSNRNAEHFFGGQLVWVLLRIAVWLHLPQCSIYINLSPITVVFTFDFNLKF